MWKEIEPNVWIPEPGESVAGVLVKKIEGTAPYGSTMYYLENDDKTCGVYGSAILDSRMAQVKVGQKVKIEFKGLEKNKNNQDVKIFKVFTEED